MMLTKALLPCLFLAFPLMACSLIMGGVDKKLEGSQGKELPDGNWYLYDTPSHWAEFQRMMDMHIEDEKNGLKPTGGHAKWNDFWGSVFRVLTPERQQNAPKYIAYIIEARRRAGLPELESYQP